MKPTYSEAFIEQAVVKLLTRGDRTVQAVATDLNINYHTAKYWIKRALHQHFSIASYPRHIFHSLKTIR